LNEIKGRHFFRYLVFAKEATRIKNILKNYDIADIKDT
tara:strand:+ start:644 stop:757 length:114 start_codon:yes stop_codon:yes gene_type:complete